MINDFFVWKSFNIQPIEKPAKYTAFIECQ